MWLNAYESMGFLGLYDELIPGRPPRLNQDQQEQIATWLDDSPRKEDYQQSNWTLKLMNHHVLQEFGQCFSLSHIWEMVHTLGFTPRVREGTNL
jgi:transposase